jgi:excisionase family DNA binding protein
MKTTWWNSIGVARQNTKRLKHGSERRQPKAAWPMSDFTISEVAEELRIRREHVLAFLKSGQLQGYDVTAPGAKRKSYRITREALDAFKAGRSAQQSKPARKRARVVRDANFVEYF